MLKHTFTKMTRPGPMRSLVSQPFMNSYSMSKFARLGSVNTGVSNTITGVNMFPHRTITKSVLSSLSGVVSSKQEYNRTFLTKKILDEQVALIQDDKISP